MPTKVDCFLDTNILIYAALGKKDEPKKFGISRALLADWNFGISAQVLGEFFVNVQRKSKRPLHASEAAQLVAELEERPCAVLDLPIVRSAIKISQRYTITYYDAAIIAAAECLGAPVVYTEDLNHGQAYSSVRVVNPFA